MTAFPANATARHFTVGYFARICPEKGLHQLVEAFRLLHKRHPNTRLRAAGYLGTRDREYFEKIREQARDLGPAFEHAGSPPTHEEKVRFLKSLDVLSVPTVYREPKGIYILEALANGVPVVQPRHGAFPEMLEATGGGLLVEPGNPEDLAALEELLKDPDGRAQLGRGGRAAVHAHYDDATMARRTLAILSGSSSSAATGPAAISVPVQACRIGRDSGPPLLDWCPGRKTMTRYERVAEPVGDRPVEGQARDLVKPGPSGRRI